MLAGIPVPGTTKARLLDGALAEFGARGYAAVGVTELAELANVTVGSLYHHFGSKTGLYDTVRTDVERRLLDRMEGAVAARPGDVVAALIIGFDYLAGAGFARLVGEPHPDRHRDPVEAFLAAQADHDRLPIGRILMAALRAALSAVADGEPASRVRSALRATLSISTPT